MNGFEDAPTPVPSRPAGRMVVDDFADLAAWRAGDTAAGDRLTRRHYDSVFRFFEVKATRAAEDLTQRTFLACCEGLDRYRGEAGFRAYLFGIARKQLLRYLRSESRFEAMRSFATAGARTGATSVSRLVVRRQEQQLLLMAFATLPTDQQIALELRYWEGMRASEIGAVLETGVSTVTSRLYRAREALRAEILRIAEPGALRDGLVQDLEHWARSLAGRGRYGASSRRGFG